MPEFGVVIHPEAIAEARAAYLWYRDRNEHVSLQFLRELEGAINKVSESPDQCPRYLAGTRYSRLRRFPYLVVFRHSGAASEVVAVAHAHRRPGYWKTR